MRVKSLAIPSAIAIGLLMTATLAHSQNNTSGALPESWSFQRVPNSLFEIPLPKTAIITIESENSYFIESSPNSWPTAPNYFFFVLQKIPNIQTFDEYISGLCYSHDGKHNIVPTSLNGEQHSMTYEMKSLLTTNELSISEIGTNCRVLFPIFTIKNGSQIYHVADMDLGPKNNLELLKLSILHMRVSSKTNTSPAIQYLLDHGIASGYPDGSFKPERTINRAEFTKIIVGAVHDAAKINECPMLSSVSPFPDVSADDWFMPFTCTARRFRIMNGYPDGTFRPSQEVNAAEAAKIVAGAFEIPIQVSASGPWFQPYMNALNALSALPSSTQDPSHLLTRGEMAEVVYRIMKR